MNEITTDNYKEFVAPKPLKKFEQFKKESA